MTSTAFSPTSICSVSTDVVARALHDETILLDLRSGTYYTLDGVGRFIWDRIGAGTPLKSIKDALLQEYDVSDEVAQRDLVAFVGTLIERGLVTV